MSKRRKVVHFTPTPAILYGRASRFIPGYGRNIRGRASQTDTSTTNLQETPPAEALATYERALTTTDEELEALQRRHRERWVQHHIFMRKTAVWEAEVYQRTKHLSEAFSTVAENIKAALSSQRREKSTPPCPAEQVPANTSIPLQDVQCPIQRVEASTEPPSSPGSDVCLSETQLDAWVNAVLTEFEGSYTETL